MILLNLVHHITQHINRIRFVLKDHSVKFIYSKRSATFLLSRLYVIATTRLVESIVSDVCRAASLLCFRCLAHLTKESHIETVNKQISERLFDCRNDDIKYHVRLDVMHLIRDKCVSYLLFECLLFDSACRYFLSLLLAFIVGLCHLDYPPL